MQFGRKYSFFNVCNVGYLKCIFSFLILWLVAIIIVYASDLPSQGGPDAFCNSFYIPPTDPLNPVYPYNNTFNISTPINWDGSGGENSLDKYR